MLYPVYERLIAALYEDPEDLYHEEDVERLVSVAGLAPGKARQIKYSAAQRVRRRQALELVA